MVNLEVAAILTEIADLLEIKGENPFKVRAYRRAAASISLLMDDVAQLVAAGSLRRVEGVGEAIAAKIAEYVETGRIDYHERLLEEVPRGLIAVRNVPGIGPKLAYKMFTHLGIADLDGLRKALETGELQKVPGVGPKAEANLRRALAEYEKSAGGYPLPAALSRAQRFLEAVRALSGVVQAEVAGGVRRRQERVDSVDIVAAAPAGEAVVARVVCLEDVGDVVAQEPGKASVRLRDGLPVQVHVVPPSAFAGALLYFTGSRQHIAALAERARRAGFHLDEHGLAAADGARLPAADEAELYRLLDLPFIPPELREGKGEIERAAAGDLPRLVTARDLRGDLHVHSTWSDGEATIEQIARRAAELGWEYVAICDHSRSLRIARGLGPEELKRQADEVRAVQAAYPQVRLLHGVEVDILSDGSLDLPDESLAALDIVVASIHSALSQERTRITQRLVRALEHPLVDIVAHPTGRRIGHRPSYDVDFDAVLEAAARTGKALEINASAGRLDLNDELAARARSAGVLLAINTDAHDLAEMETIHYGVWIARRAWCGPEAILNTRPAGSLIEWLRARRGAQGA